MRRPAGITAIVLILAIAGAASGWFLYHGSRVSWARHAAVPEIERLFNAGDRDGAMRLLYEAKDIIPDDPSLARYFRSISIPLTLTTEPPGATAYATGYNHPYREWIRLGETPLVEIPVCFPARLRIEKEGYDTFEGAPVGLDERVRLFREGEAPSGMVYVSGGRAGFGAVASVVLDEFWIDKFETTNRQYKAFIDAGGYREDRFWAPSVDRRTFIDATGRPGPAGWTLGDYPEGEDDLPVGGVSWFEASAYATWAGKSLPTVFHWRLAARQSIFSEILVWSNFESTGPVEVGSTAGLGPNGTYDMAGNIREWCLNPTGTLRYVLGGAWSDPDYLYRDTEADDPYDRSPTNGFRCMLTTEPPPPESLAAIDHVVIDHRRDTAIDDELYEIVRRDFEYDHRELDAELVAADDRHEHWHHEIVSIRAAYGDDRLPIHLYLPKKVEPPYQAVVYFPPSSARFLNDSTYPSSPFGYFIPQSGRALVYPIYRGTYERRVEARGPNDARDEMIQIGKDLRRAIDYLQTRDDIDDDKLAFYGVSWGGSIGPVLTAIEARFDASVLLAGGLSHYPSDWPAVNVPQNFASRCTVPTLMINGRDDFLSPVETNIRPMFEMLGTPDEDKRLVLLDGGHVPTSSTEVIREVLDWLDTYLGPVDGG